MDIKPYKQWLHILFLAPLMLISCGSDSPSNATGATSTGSTSTSSSSANIVSISGVIADPFIVGAVLCEDKDASDTCDTGEPVSSASDAAGNFTFSEALTAGSHIIIKTQGKHEGVTYDLAITGLVDSSGNIPVVSPLTTLATRGLTAVQIASILNAAAAAQSITLSDNTTPWSIASNQILGNPMANNISDTKISALTESELSTLQASLAMYAMLKIMNGSARLQSLASVDLYTSATTGEVSRIAQEVLSRITSTLTKQALTDIKTTIDTGRTALATGLTSASPAFYPPATATAKAQASIPEPSMLLPIKVVVSIIDKLATVGFTTCNATVGTDTAKVTAALTAVGNTATTIIPLIPQLGEQLYGMTYQTQLSQLEDVGGGTNIINQLSTNLQTGYNAKKAGKVTYRFDNLNTITAL